MLKTKAIFFILTARCLWDERLLALKLAFPPKAETSSPKAETSFSLPNTHFVCKRHATRPEFLYESAPAFAGCGPSVRGRCAPRTRVLLGRLRCLGRVRLFHPRPRSFALSPPSYASFGHHSRARLALPARLVGVLETHGKSTATASTLPDSHRLKWTRLEDPELENI